MIVHLYMKTGNRRKRKIAENMLRATGHSRVGVRTSVRQDPRLGSSAF